MYLEHFGLRELPFSITPDTSFFFNYAGHQEALNTLLVALRSGEGFIKIVGEVGTGKTLLCRKILNIFSEDDDYVTAYIPNPYLTPAALNMALADELDLEYARNLGQHRILRLINDRLIQLTAAGKRVVLFIDEAQAMPEPTLEALRLLTNLETEKQKLLQIVLFGQPELDVILDRPSVRQLRQRIAFAYRLSPMDRSALGAYVAHRLVVAGYGGAALFDRAAIKALYRGSRGIPRLVNIVGHKALMLAYGRGNKRVTQDYVRAAVRDTEDTVIGRRSVLDKLMYGVMGIAASVAVGFSAFYYLGMIT